MTKQFARNFILIWTFGLFLSGCLVSPTIAQNKYKKGDEVIVDIYGDGREICPGVVSEVYQFSSGTSYSVKWDCGNGYGAGNSGTVPANRLRPRNAVQKPNTPTDSAAQKPVRKPVNTNNDEEEDSVSKVSNDDLEWFFGKWKLSRYGGGSEVERNGKIYRETLMYVAKAEPITINSNGTYLWTVRDGSTIKGK